MSTLYAILIFIGFPIISISAFLVNLFRQHVVRPVSYYGFMYSNTTRTLSEVMSVGDDPFEQLNNLRQLLGKVIYVFLASIFMAILSYGVFQWIDLDQSADSSHILSSRWIVGPAGWVLQSHFVLATIACAMLWPRFTDRGIQYPEVFTIAIWVVFRSVVFIAHLIVNPSGTELYSDMVPEWAGLSVVVWFAALAFGTAMVSIAMAIRGIGESRLVLVMVVPFVAMTFQWHTQFVGTLFPIDPWFTMLIFGYAVSNAMMMMRYTDIDEHPYTHAKRLQKYISTTVTVVLIVSIGVATWWIANLITSNPDMSDDFQEHILIYVVSKWLMIPLICAFIIMIFRIIRLNFPKLPLLFLIWTTIVWSTSQIVSEVGLTYLQILVGGYVALFIGIVAVPMGILRIQWPIGWSIVSTLTLILAIRQNPANPFSESFFGWLDLSATILVLFFGLFYVFGPTRWSNEGVPSD